MTTSPASILRTLLAEAEQSLRDAQEGRADTLRLGIRIEVLKEALAAVEAGADVGGLPLPTEIGPVDQTVVGIGNTRANCFQACLAMISGLPLDDCIDITDPAVEDMWVDAVIEWAAQYGWAFKTGIRPPQDRPCIANGPTADREGVHGVVCAGGNLFHDPHPSRSGIVSVNWYGWLEPLANHPHPAPAVADVAGLVERYSREKFTGGLGASRPAIEAFAQWVDAQQLALKPALAQPAPSGPFDSDWPSGCSADEPVPPAPVDDAVTQEDRRQAADLYRYTPHATRQAIKDMRDGRMDNHAFVQAFRNHRLRYRPAASGDAVDPYLQSR